MSWYYRHYWTIYLVVIQLAMALITWRWQIWWGQYLVHLCTWAESPWMT